MSRALCLDTTGLIHFEAAGALPILELMCTQDGSASVPVSVVGEWHGHSEDAAGHVTGHPWLKQAEDDPPLIDFIANRGRAGPDGLLLAAARAAMNAPVP